jgi:hypothetical protein
MEVDEVRMRVVADTSTVQLAVWVDVPWMGLDAEDRPLLTVTAGSRTPTVYVLDWEAP